MALERNFSVQEVDLDEPRQKGCGVIGIHYPTPVDISELVIPGLSAIRGVWHRGQQGFGGGVQTESGLQKYVKRGTIDEVLTPDLPEKFQGAGKAFWILLHSIYSTYGGQGLENMQPIEAKASDGSTAAVIHNGEFVNTDWMERQLKQTGTPIPEEASDTYLFTQILAQSQANSWEERILDTLSKVNGAYSLIIGAGEKLFIARDQFGIRPLVLGKIGEGWIAASETWALHKLGVRPEREVKPGEIIRLDKSGLRIIQEGLSGPGNLCDVEKAYFMMPTSTGPTHEDGSDADHPENWVSNESFRERCGEILAEEKPIPSADFVVGVPDSGIAAAHGYANRLRLPYRPAIIRDHYDPNGRSRIFMRDDLMNDLERMIADMSEMERMVLTKLIPIPERRIWEGKVVVVIDDTQMRGIVSKPITRVLFGLGAKEVHWGYAYPPVRYTCHLGTSLRNLQELIAARHNGDERKIAQETGATSVSYISPEGFNRAKTLSGIINVPEDPREIFLANGGCGGCVTGLHPISKEGVIYQASSQNKKQAQVA